MAFTKWNAGISMSQTYCRFQKKGQNYTNMPKNFNHQHAMSIYYGMEFFVQNLDTIFAVLLIYNLVMSSHLNSWFN